MTTYTQNTFNLLSLQEMAELHIRNRDIDKANEVALQMLNQLTAQGISEEEKEYAADPEMPLFAPAINLVTAIMNLMSGVVLKSNNAMDSDEAFARMLQNEEYANFAQEEDARLNQTYNDLILAKKLQQENDDEAFARMLQEQDDADFADADFAYALSLQFEDADMLGASASYAGLGAIGHDYYNAFYAA